VPAEWLDQLQQAAFLTGRFLHENELTALDRAITLFRQLHRRTAVGSVGAVPGPRRPAYGPLVCGLHPRPTGWCWPPCPGCCPDRAGRSSSSRPRLCCAGTARLIARHWRITLIVSNSNSCAPGCGAFPPADQAGPGWERGQQGGVDRVGQLDQFGAVAQTLVAVEGDDPVPPAFRRVAGRQGLRQPTRNDRRRRIDC
jgi:hypothetical protein